MAALLQSTSSAFHGQCAVVRTTASSLPRRTFSVNPTVRASTGVAVFVDKSESEKTFRLKSNYLEKIIPILKDEFSYTNIHEIDDGEWKIYPQVTALCIGNAKYFGGGMKITPNAEPTNGNFEVLALQDFRWYDFILKLHKLYNGTHLSVRNVLPESVHSIEIEQIDGSEAIYIPSDGEHIGFLPRKLSILPGAIELLT